MKEGSFRDHSCRMCLFVECWTAATWASAAEKWGGGQQVLPQVTCSFKSATKQVLVVRDFP